MECKSGKIRTTVHPQFCLKYPRTRAIVNVIASGRIILGFHGDKNRGMTMPEHSMSLWLSLGALEPRFWTALKGPIKELGRPGPHGPPVILGHCNSSTDFCQHYTATYASLPVLWRKPIIVNVNIKTPDICHYGKNVLYCTVHKQEADRRQYQMTRI